MPFRRYLTTVGLLLWCALGIGCTTVETERTPSHSPLLVARAGGEVLLSWTTRTGDWYTVLYTDGRKTGADWRPMANATRVPGNGQEMRFTDYPPVGVNRYYRLLIEPN